MNVKKTSISIIFGMSLLFISCTMTKPTSQELSSFYEAIKENDVDNVRNAIKKNKNIINVGLETFNGDIMYPIHLVLLKSNKYELVELIANMGTINSVFCGVAPFGLAIRQNMSTDILKLLIERGANVIQRDIAEDLNIFQVFVLYGNRDYETWNLISNYATKELLNEEYGTENEHITPLYYLVYHQVNDDIDKNPNSTIKLLKEFIEKGANPNVFVYFEEFITETIDICNEFGFEEYKTVLLNGMRNSEPIENSMELLQKLERM